MRFQHYISLLASASAVLALQLTNGQLSRNDVSSPFSESGKAIQFNSTTEKLEITFDIKHTKKPEQIFIKLSNPAGLETSFKPVTKLTNDVYKNKLALTYKKLPTAFQTAKDLILQIIIADDEAEEKIFDKIGSIELTDSLIAQSKYQPAEKFGLKPEIHHMFQQPPKQVNSFIAVIFAIAAQVILVALIGVWFQTSSLNFQNFQLNINNLAFIGLILSYEFIFLQYSRGSSIFTTISKVLILLGPTIWFGSRVLNYMGELRLAGKR